MYIKSNDNFKDMLGRDYLNKITSVKLLLSPKLTNSKIIVRKDCYYLKLFSPPMSKSQTPVFDKVGSECFFNRFLIDNFIDQKLSNKQYLLQGCKFAIDLAEKLANFTPSKFKIIVSFQKGRKYYTKVTFHKIRKGENYLARNLNDYKDNGLMIIYT